jgi:hypothetical protein
LTSSERKEWLVATDSTTEDTVSARPGLDPRIRDPAEVPVAVEAGSQRSRHGRRIDATATDDSHPDRHRVGLGRDVTPATGEDQSSRGGG